MFAGPVCWTGKKTEIKLQATGCSCTNSEIFWLPVAMFVEKSKNQKKNQSRPVATGLSSRHALDLTYAHFSSTLQCPSHSCRNPLDSSGMELDSTGIHRNGTGIELELSEIRLARYIYTNMPFSTLTSRINLSYDIDVLKFK